LPGLLEKPRIQRFFNSEHFQKKKKQPEPGGTLILKIFINPEPEVV
jgi:hypothetical protein